MVVSLRCRLLILIAYTLEAEGGEQGRVVSPLKDCQFRELLNDDATCAKRLKCFHLTASRKVLRLHSSMGPPSGYFKSLLITACIFRHGWGYCSLTTLWLGKVLYEAYWAQSKAIVAFITATRE